MEDAHMNCVKDQQSNSCQRGSGGIVHQLENITGLLVYKTRNSHFKMNFANCCYSWMNIKIHF